MAQRKNGSDRAPDHIPVQRRKRKDGRTGRQKSDLDYHLDEAQDRKTAGRKRPGGLAVNTDVAQEGFADCLFRLGERKERQSGQERPEEWRSLLCSLLRQ